MMRTIEINLLPFEDRPGPAYRIRNISMFVLSFGVLIFLAVNGYQVFAKEKTLEQKNEELGILLGSYGSFNRSIKKLRKRKNLLNEHHDNLTAVIKQRITWSDKLSQIYTQIPDGIWLSEISIQREKSQGGTGKTKNPSPELEIGITLYIRGEAEDLTNITDLFGNLGKLTFLADLNFRSSHVRQLDERPILSFVMTAKLDTEGSVVP
jgi:Tfp pilus assembly protein PilN